MVKKDRVRTISWVYGLFLVVEHNGEKSGGKSSPFFASQFVKVLQSCPTLVVPRKRMISFVIANDG
ncbi:hypothetical protein DP117_21435 [Brasilonema sp. UFV-L1]|nr:hypothetical protein [Brasilonema sp. UFV-L1]